MAIGNTFDTNFDPNNVLLQRTNFEKWTTLEELTLDTSDDELKTMIQRWMSISGSSNAILKTNGEINKRYYRWIDLRTDNIVDDRSVVTDNRIFTNLETVVPLVTSRLAQPIVFIPSAEGKWNTDKKIREQAIKNQKVLLAIAQEQKLQSQYEKMVRQHQIYHIWVVKYGIQDWKIFARVLLPSRLLLDSEAIDINDSEFIWEKIVIVANDLVKKYPDKEEEISNEVQGKMSTKLTYIEWWSDEIKVVSIESRVILEKQKNPLFDYTWFDKETFDEHWKKIQKTTDRNFFIRPKKPYIRFSVYNIGENILDDTTSLELSKRLQDNINDRKRQIADNANIVGNPIRTYNWFSKDQANQANLDLRAWDWVSLNWDQSINYVQAESLPAYLNNDLNDTRNSIDNIFGIHSTTRGERLWAESWKAREALREWDEDRQATIGRAIEEVSEELYNAFAHLVKVFYDTEEVLPILWKDETEEFVKFKRDDIAEGMKIRVRPWSTIPDDPNALKAQAIELLTLNKITTRRAYEMMWLEDADEAAQELEVEVAKAQVEQQKILADEQKEEAVKGQTSWFEEQIGAIQ